ncbi:RNA modification enzyme, MiaB family [Chloroherpeton thalassium ATCC 35110]|uniref:RNA modification enzyme, MiaB family n=1 Tax=Chloroherpeton thalassium (strain ATCC 35110 / GB-78) TaxID=517418 RepID=B3QT78_CHLT3|nr:hypothetical protein [Chloroherpeton thalassium]ACF14177.1 RNA modification enzyme, MiaB family [Chloroherpeton thalassium ATCC 35110]
MPAEKQARSRKLHALSVAKKEAFANAHVGKVAEVLFEGDFSDDEVDSNTVVCYGHTPNYLRVGLVVSSKAWAMQHLVGKVLPVKLMKLDAELNLLAERVPAAV